MSIWNKSAGRGSTPDEAFARLIRHGRAKVQAAERLAVALGEANRALLDLVAADSAFFGELRKCDRADSVSSMRLARELRTLLIGELEITAPELSTRLQLPRRVREKCEPLAKMVARWVEMDTPARAES
jgi:hypothetical protein